MSIEDKASVVNSNATAAKRANELSYKYYDKPYDGLCEYQKRAINNILNV